MLDTLPGALRPSCTRMDGWPATGAVATCLAATP
jgi:hypothetical protein